MLWRTEKGDEAHDAPDNGDDGNAGKGPQAAILITLFPCR